MNFKNTRDQQNSPQQSKRNRFIWGVGFTAVLVGAVSGFVYFTGHQEGDRDLSSTPVVQIKKEVRSQTNLEKRLTSRASIAKKINHVHGSYCKHHNSVAKKSEIKSIKEVRFSKKEGILSARVGDRIEISFGDELKVLGKVNMNKEVVGGRKAIGMDLVGEDGYVYWLQDPSGGVVGSVVIRKKDGNQAFRFKKKAGAWTLEKLPYENYICSSGGKVGVSLIPKKARDVSSSGLEASVIPILNSNLGAESVIYLDFDGETVSGTRWNASIGGKDIVAKDPGLSEELVRAIWEECAEDMRPFQFNVTTDLEVFKAAPVNKRMQCIITPTNEVAPGAGGVAFLNSFYDGSVDPCWNFNMSDSDSTCSHETGHTFGLHHDGLNGQEYHPGNGTWGPIMGAPFENKVISWSKGDYKGATNTKEDDLAIIAAHSAPYRVDDYGNSLEDAYELTAVTDKGEDIDLTGNIEKTTDVDAFVFNTAGGAIDLKVTSPAKRFSNMNIKLSLLDSDGKLLEESEEPGYEASLKKDDLKSGTYYLYIEGIGDGSPDISGFNDYGSLGLYNIKGTIEGLGGPNAEIIEPSIEQLSIVEGHGLFLKASNPGPVDLSRWEKVDGPGSVQFTSDDKDQTQVVFSEPGLYKLKWLIEDKGMKSEDIIEISVEKSTEPKKFANRGPNLTILSPAEFNSEAGVLKALVRDDKVPSPNAPQVTWRVLDGDAVISKENATWTQIKFMGEKENLIQLEAFDGEIRTFKTQKIVSHYQFLEMFPEGKAIARYLVPTASTVLRPQDWTSPSFNDRSWALSDLGIGYNVQPDYVHYLGKTAASGVLLDKMKGKYTSLYVRIPFTLSTVEFAEKAKLSIRYNDGFVMYVNGREVLRRNTSVFDMAWNSVATKSRSLVDVQIADENFDMSKITPYLRVGRNVIAFHVLIKNKGRNKLLLAPSFKIGVVDNPSGGSGGSVSDGEGRKFDYTLGNLPSSNTSFGVRNKGKYAGVLLDAAGKKSLGYLKSMKVNKKGRFSAKLNFKNALYSVKGEFNKSGYAKVVATSKGGRSVVVKLQMVKTSEGGYRIDGTIEAGNEIAYLVAVKAGASVKQVGNYTLLILDEDDVIRGPGYGVMKVSSKGTVKMKGVLADGNKWTAKTIVSKDGEMPLYAKLYVNRGSLAGMVRFRNQKGISDCDSLLSWEKTGRGKFSVQRYLIGSRFSASKRRLMSNLSSKGVNVEMLASDTSGANVRVRDLTWTSKNKILYVGTEKIKMKVNGRTGLVKGKISSQSGKSKIQGVFFKKQNIVSGLITPKTGKTRKFILAPKK